MTEKCPTKYRPLEEVLREAMRTAGLHSKPMKKSGVEYKRMEDFYNDVEPLLVSEMDSIARALGLAWMLVPLAPNSKRIEL